MTAASAVIADGIIRRKDDEKGMSPPARYALTAFSHSYRIGGASGVEVECASDVGSNGLGTQACAARGIRMARTIATRKSAGTSPNK
jgi:hypothetical protein